MFHEIIRPLVSPIARAIYQPTIEGLENVPRTGAAILAPNHLSFAENWIIPTALPRPVHFLIKVEYVQGPGAGGRLVAAFYRQLGYVPVQRGGPRDTVGGSLENALKVLAAGKVFAIYPEGTRSPDGRMYKGHTGVARLALASGAPVVPIGCIGTDQMHPVGKRLPRRCPVTIRFGKPLDFSQRSGVDDPRVWREVTDEIVQAIRQLSGQDYVDRYKNQQPQS